jgi:quaternary ammonium compound-resistance protein SugE
MAGVLGDAGAKFAFTRGVGAMQQVLTLAWVYLVAAGLFEIGWPVGLQMAQKPGGGIVGTLVAIVFITISGSLLSLAMKEISIGTAYAVWTGIGAAGTFLVGVWFFGDAATLARFLGAALIVAGVVVLKLAH